MFFFTVFQKTFKLQICTIPVNQYVINVPCTKEEVHPKEVISPN